MDERQALRRPFRPYSGRKIGIAVISFTFAFALASAILVAPNIHFARAAGATLTVSPSSGPYSAWNEETANGTGYGAQETVNIYWNYTGPGTGTQVATATTDTSGSFSASFKRVLAPTGTYTIAGVGQSSGSVATGTFLLLPQIYVGPLDTGPGSQFHVNGNSFGNGETVNIYWNYTGPGTGLLFTTVTANTTGSFLVNSNVPSNTPPGYLTVAGIGQTTGTTATAQIYIYPPTLALAPLRGTAGTVLTMSAYGFTPFENVSLYWNNGTTPISTVKTNTYGYLSITTFTVPAGTSPGSYPLTAVGATSHITITNTYTLVAPGSSLQTTSGPTGASVNVSGQGYAPNETVNILWNYTGPGTGTTLASATAGAAGTINTSFTVPTQASGTYSVAIVGASSNSVTQNSFNISNGLATSLPTAPPGSNVTVSGTGYQANEQVNLNWDSSSGPLLATATADANGNISQGITLPTSATPGAHNLVGAGQASTQTFTAPVTIDTTWSDFGFDGAHNHQNTFENTLNTSNVGKLNLKWTATTNIHVRNSGCGALGNVSSPIYANGTVFYATDDGYLNAYNATTGAIKWQFNSGTAFPNCSSPLYDPATGMVFFGLVGNNGSGVPTPFYALDAQTGALEWSTIFPWNEYAFPTVASNTLYIGMSREGYGEPLYAVDELTGLIKWSQPTSGGVWGEVVADPNTNTIFTGIGNPAPHIDARNATTGALIWEFTPISFGKDDDVGAPITLANGIVYASDKNGIIYALNESTGALVWSTTIGAQSNQDVSAPAVTADGKVYVGSNDNPLYVLDANTGAILWKYTTRGPVYSSPAVANGIVYFSSTDHRFYALNATTGALAWTYLTGGKSFSSPIVANGWFYCGASDGKLYAFSL